MKEDKLIAIFSKYDFDDNYTEEQAILSAMKEAMREESIGFADWVADNTYSRYNDSKGVKHWKILGSIKNFTTDQLYNEYLKHNEK